MVTCAPKILARYFCGTYPPGGKAPVQNGVSGSYVDAVFQVVVHQVVFHGCVKNMVVSTPVVADRKEN